MKKRRGYGLVVKRDLAKVESAVRFRLPANEKGPRKRAFFILVKMRWEGLVAKKAKAVSDREDEDLIVWQDFRMAQNLTGFRWYGRLKR